MTVFASAAGHAAHLERDWTPIERTLAIDLAALSESGSIIFPEAAGHLPGLKGRLNPIRDTHDRTYLYASNIAINEDDQRGRSTTGPLYSWRGTIIDRCRKDRTVRTDRRYRRPVGACRDFR